MEAYQGVLESRGSLGMVNKEGCEEANSSMLSGPHY